LRKSIKIPLATRN